MFQVKLFTQDGGFVANVEIPPFKSWPDVLLWGQRIFQKAQTLDPDGLATYRECFAYAVPVIEPRRELPLDMNPGGYDGDAD